MAYARLNGDSVRCLTYFCAQEAFPLCTSQLVCTLNFPSHPRFDHESHGTFRWKSRLHWSRTRCGRHWCRFIRSGGSLRRRAAPENSTDSCAWEDTQTGPASQLQSSCADLSEKAWVALCKTHVSAYAIKVILINDIPMFSLYIQYSMCSSTHGGGISSSSMCGLYPFYLN